MESGYGLVRSDSLDFTLMHSNWLKSDSDKVYYNWLKSDYDAVYYNLLKSDSDAMLSKQ